MPPKRKAAQAAAERTAAATTPAKRRRGSKAEPSFHPPKTSLLMPYLLVEEGDKALEFYKDVLDAKIGAVHREGPDNTGKIMNAQVGLGDLDNVFMLSEGKDAKDVQVESEFPPLSIYTFVPDVTKVFNTAIEKGAKSLQEPKKMVYGMFEGRFRDPWGHNWSVASVVSAEEEKTTEEQKEDVTLAPAGGAEGEQKTEAEPEAAAAAADAAAANEAAPQETAASGQDVQGEEDQ